MKKKKTTKKKSKPRKIISRKEPPAFSLENEAGKACGLVLCDHAAARVPEALGDLGLPRAELKRHIAVDIGARAAALRLAKKLGMPAVLAEYSRLVVDLNRGPHHVESMPEVSDHTIVPGNTALSRAARAQRLKEFYWPYHKAAGRKLDALARRKDEGGKKKPFVVSVHSMTPVLDGKKRPWHVSVLWNKEAEIGRAVVRNLRKLRPDILVGENEPYTLAGDRLEGSTLWRHAEERGFPCVLVEFRQDLVATSAQARAWADLFAQALAPVIAGRGRSSS